MTGFVDTKNIKDLKELKQKLLENIYYADELRGELKQFQNSELLGNNINGEQLEEKYIELEEDDVDVTEEYLYYYEEIKNCDKDMPFDEVKEIIKNNLPSLDNSNYFNIIGYIKAEIGREMMELYNLCDGSDIKFVNEVNEYLNFYRQVLNVIDSLSYEKLKEQTEKHENRIIFLETTSGNVYAKEDLENIDLESYESFKEIYESIKNGSFKNVKRFASNNKIKGLSQVKMWQTRLIFDRVNADTYIIINLFIKKCNTETTYAFDTISRRNSLYQSKKQEIIAKLNDEDFLSLNRQYQEEFESILNNSKKK